MLRPRARAARLRFMARLVQRLVSAALFAWFLLATLAVNTAARRAEDDGLPYRAARRFLPRSGRTLRGNAVSNDNQQLPAGDTSLPQSDHHGVTEQRVGTSLPQSDHHGVTEQRVGTSKIPKGFKTKKGTTGEVYGYFTISAWTGANCTGSYGGVISWALGICVPAPFTHFVTHYHVYSMTIDPYRCDAGTTHRAHSHSPFTTAFPVLISVQFLRDARGHRVHGFVVRRDHFRDHQRDREPLRVQPPDREDAFYPVRVASFPRGLRRGRRQRVVQRRPDRPGHGPRRFAVRRQQGGSMPPPSTP